MEHITMNRKEREQLIVFRKLKNGEITQSEAALQLKVSARWVRKKYKRYQEFGDIGLVHKNRGKASKKRWNEQEKALTIELLQSDWKDFGPTFTAEKLEELKGIKISKETLRKAMIQAGVWQGKKRKLTYRRRRERRKMIGVMVQLDGSPHDWFEGRAPRCTLLVFIDDATSTILWLEFAKSESKIDVMRATKNYMLQHGIPQEFYIDFGAVFSVNLNNYERDKKTDWEKAVEFLSVTVHHAHSPQAKGRVERSNGTLQDRLVKEMRLAGISSIEAANQFLREKDFITKHNKKFAESPAEHGNAHRPLVDHDLDDIFVVREERVLMQDYTLTYNKQIFQLEKQQRTIIRPKDVITVKTRLDGSIELFIRKTKLMYKLICKSSNNEMRKDIIKTYKPYKYNKPSENSRRWVSGLRPLPTALFPK